VVEGKVTKIVAFGAFVQILPGVEGLVHISELAQHHVESPAEVVRPGDELKVQILEVDDSRRRLSLSVKRVEGQELPQRDMSDAPPLDGAPAAEAPPAEEEAPPAEEDAPPAEEPPAEDAPAAEEPAVEEPAAEVPAETPAEAPADTPAEAPVEETPPAEAPAEDGPPQEAPAEDAPPEEAPAEDAPPEEAPAKES
jgi:small subunit ribosomal protein S1